MASFEELKRRVLDNSLSREERLLAFWTLSAAHWRQRTHRAMHAEHADIEDDKISIARKNGVQARLLRMKAARVAASPRYVKKITGTMVTCDRSDNFANLLCVECGSPFTPNKPGAPGRVQAYCTPACRQSAYRNRSAA